MILRDVETHITKRLTDKKVIMIYGPRQVGKTTFLNDFFVNHNVLLLNGDDADTRDFFKDQSTSFFKRMLSSYDYLIVDEAQRIPNIGLAIKQIHDQLGMKVILTGSSSVFLADKTKEPLTGRKWEYNLYPISFGEMVNHHGLLEEKRLLNQRLLYGYYPDVVTNPSDAVEILKNLTDSYLYKDILMFEQIKKSGKLEKLVRALAFQIGNEVSHHELGQLVGLHPETVEHYIDLLEKMFIIYKLPSYSKNLRNEIKKGKKYYFYDLGIRNTVINNFNSLEFRNDIGAMWENFIIIERIKHKEYHRIFSKDFFWRTHTQQEIDFLEEREGKLFAYEFKWNDKKKAKLSKSFQNAYPDHEFEVITPNNFYDFVLE